MTTQAAAADSHYTPRQAPTETSGEFGVKELFDVVARRWKVLVGTVLLVTIVVLGATYLMTPMYKSTSVLKIDPTEKAVTDDDLRTTSPQADQARIATDVQVLQSRDIARKVIQQLKLANDPEFRGDSETQNNALATAESIVIDNFLARLDVKHESDSYIVEVSFRSSSSRKAAAITNALVETFVESTVADRTGVAASQAEWLKQRFDALGSEISATENQIAQYRAQAGIAEGSTQGTVTDAQVGPISSQLAVAESDAASANAVLQAARAQIQSGQLAAVSSVLNSPVIGDLRRQRSEASRELAQVEARYGPRHPEYERVNKQVQDIDAGLKDEAKRIVSALASSAQAAQARASSLRASLDQIRGQQASNTRAAVVADSLERRATTKQRSYEDLGKTLQQVSEKQRDVLPTAMVVQHAAESPKPFSPNRALFGAMGLMLGLLTGFALTLLLEFLSRNIRSGDELERCTGIPYLASVPRLSASQLKYEERTLTPEDFVVFKPMSSYVEAFRTIRNSLVLSAAEPPKVIAVLSALPSEGKSTVSISLARTMALSGDRVLIIDCDLRRGRVHEALGIESSTGLIEVLMDKIASADAIVRDSLTEVDVLSLHGHSFTPVDLFSSEAMTKLLTEMRERYDFVILDTAPLLAVADSRIIASLADGAIFVAHSDRTPDRAARLAIDFTRQDGSKMTGSVLSMSTTNARRTSSKDPTYYYEKYRQYQDG
ncbi:GumC family protein [Rhizorhabdus argentea]|uniref:GumC family protein n=1 Tax=Rhizorhabdus argentea TaxID=1387174 RepID=UPI0030EB9050